MWLVCLCTVLQRNSIGVEETRSLVRLRKFKRCVIWEYLNRSLVESWCFSYNAPFYNMPLWSNKSARWRKPLFLHHSKVWGLRPRGNIGLPNRGAIGVWGDWNLRLLANLPQGKKIRLGIFYFIYFIFTGTHLLLKSSGISCNSLGLLWSLPGGGWSLIVQREALMCWPHC